MRKIVYLLTCIVISAFTLKVKGQNTLPPVYEIKADTANNIEIPDKDWQFLEDKTGSLTIGQVSSPAFDAKFHANTTRTKGFDYSVTTYWARYRIKNTLPYPVEITIPENVTYAWLYTPAPNNKWDVKVTGSLLPWSKRDGLKRIIMFVKEIKPGEVMQFYERNVIDFNIFKPKIFAVNFGFAKVIINNRYVNNEKSYTQSIVSGIILGVLLMAGLINLMFFRIVREKTYLYFSLLVISFGLEIFLSVTDLLFKEYRYVYMYIPLFFLTVAFYSIMHFIRHFLSTKTYTPKWDKFLVILSYIIVATWIVAAYLPPSLSYKTFFAITVVTGILIYTYMPVILFTVLFYYRINRSARLGFIAILPGLLWWGLCYTYEFVAGVLHEIYKTPYSKFYLWVQDVDSFMTLILFTWLIAIFSWILFKRYQDLQQSLIQSSLDREIERGQLIEKQNEELEKKVEIRTTELKQSVEELKATQQQLVQSEKLASLGELTAGIAHEIQNPLNFVNNFSEVSMELTVEIKEELKNGNTADALAIVDDIEQNLEKIIHHGRRADNIVKNMLQHSRNNSAEKQPTDINALADEYLRLSYHGLRAKDKSFNANMSTDLDPSLRKIDVISQDVGRVLLNLFNNAFYAVQQRKKEQGDSYKPEVKVSTAMNGKFIEIKVTDNGTGIADTVKGKILQPFFTTKPTGEGTGLGLSLSYDIVVKGHGGTMDINSKEGEYTEFVVRLPA